MLYLVMTSLFILLRMSQQQQLLLGQAAAPSAPVTEEQDSLFVSGLKVSPSLAGSKLQVTPVLDGY